MIFSLIRSKSLHIKYLRFPVVLIFVNIIWFFKIPSAYQKIYAEDGVIYLNDALSKPFISGITDTYAGYAGTIGRLGGTFTALFPLKYASVSLAFFSSMVISLIAMVTYVNTEKILRSKVVRLGLSTAIIMLPIANSESTATVCNLYNFLFFGAFIVVISMKDITKPQILALIVLILSVLSNPLTVVLLLIPIIRFLVSRVHKSFFKIAVVEWVLALGLLIHAMIIILDSTKEIRGPLETSSLIKVIYLFLDRVIGSSIIPGWGLVSGSQTNPGYENSFWFFENLVLRLVITSILYALFFCYSMWFIWARRDIDTRVEFVTAFIIWHFYILSTGYFYNVEPRYSIFSSLLFLWLLGYLVSNVNLKRLSKKTLAAIFSFVVLLSGLVAQPSNLRISGPAWGEGLAAAKIACRENASQSAKIRILPMNSVRLVIVECSRLVGK